MGFSTLWSAHSLQSSVPVTQRAGPPQILNPSGELHSVQLAPLPPSPPLPAAWPAPPAWPPPPRPPSKCGRIAEDSQEAVGSRSMSVASRRARLAPVHRCSRGRSRAARRLRRSQAAANSGAGTTSHAQLLEAIGTWAQLGVTRRQHPKSSDVAGGALRRVKERRYHVSGCCHAQSSFGAFSSSPLWAATHSAYVGFRSGSGAQPAAPPAVAAMKLATSTDHQRAEPIAFIETSPLPPGCQDPAGLQLRPAPHQQLRATRCALHAHRRQSERMAPTFGASVR